MPVVYADVVWFVNLCMDAALLATTLWIVKRRSTVLRIGLGALMGSLYAMLLFLPSLSTLTTWPGKAVASLLMIWVAIPCKSWVDLIRYTVMYYFVAFVYAGATIAIHFAIPGVSVASGTLISGQHLAFMTTGKSLALIIALPLGFGVVRYVLSRTRVYRQLTQSLYTVEVTLFSQTITVIGLADTGNQLRHPLTGRPVCLVEMSAVEGILPQSLCDAIVQEQPVYDIIQNLDPDIVSRFTIVPFRAAGGKENWMLAFRPDEVYWVDGEVRHKGAACLVGIQVAPLSKDHRFQAILHIDVITGDDEFESTRPGNQQYKTSNSPPIAMDESPPDAFGR